MRRLLVLAAFAAIPATAFAKGEPAFEITQTAYSFRHATETEKPKSGDSTDTTTDEFVSMPADLELQFAYEKWRFDVHPLDTGGVAGVAYEFIPHWEVGLDLGYNRSRVDSDDAPKSTTSLSIIPNIQYSWEQGSNTVEFALHAGWVQNNSRESATDAKTSVVTITETKESGFEAELEVNYYRDVTENFSFGGGASFTYGASKDKAADTTLGSQEIEVRLIQLRYGIY